MRNTNATILKTVAETLQSAVLPAVRSDAPAAAGAGGLCLALLGIVLSRETQMAGVVEEYAERFDALRQRMEEVLVASGADPDPVAASALDGIAEDGYDEAHLRLLRAQAGLSSTAARLADVGRGSEAAAIESLLREAGEAELQLIGAFFATLTPKDAEAVEAPEVTAASPEATERYLVDRFPERKGLRVTDVTASGHSMSKAVVFVSVVDDAGAAEDLVFRQEKAIRFMEPDCTLVRNEFAAIKGARTLGLPVPEPLWLETSGALGPDLMVSERATGTPIGEPFRAFQPLSEDLVMQIAEILGRLHGGGLEPFEQYFRDSGQAEVLDMTVKEAMLHRIAVWKDYFSGPQEFPSPSKAWLFHWLERNVPENDAVPVFVHGDFNIHNMLGDGERVTALLDWEFAHAGNGLEDLQNVRHHVDEHSSWDRFVQHYQAHGGPQVEDDPKILSYNRCLTNTIFACSANRLARHVAAGDLGDVAAVFGGDSYGFEFQRMALGASLDKA